MIAGFAERTEIKVEPNQEEFQLDLKTIGWLRLPHTQRFIEYLENLAAERVQRAKQLSRQPPDNFAEMRQALREVVLIEEILEYARRTSSE